MLRQSRTNSSKSIAASTTPTHRSHQPAALAPGRAARQCQWHRGGMRQPARLLLSWPQMPSGSTSPFSVRSTRHYECHHFAKRTRWLIQTLCDTTSQAWGPRKRCLDWVKAAPAPASPTGSHTVPADCPSSSQGCTELGATDKGSPQCLRAQYKGDTGSSPCPTTVSPVSPQSAPQSCQPGAPSEEIKTHAQLCHRSPCPKSSTFLPDLASF